MHFTIFCAIIFFLVKLQEPAIPSDPTSGRSDIPTFIGYSASGSVTGTLSAAPFYLHALFGFYVESRSWIGVR